MASLPKTQCWPTLSTSDDMTTNKRLKLDDGLIDCDADFDIELNPKRPRTCYDQRTSNNPATHTPQQQPDSNNTAHNQQNHCQQQEHSNSMQPSSELADHHLLMSTHVEDEESLTPPIDATSGTSFSHPTPMASNNVTPATTTIASNDGILAVPDTPPVDDEDSCMSGEDWKPTSSTGPFTWVQAQIERGTSPHDILTELLPNAHISPDIGDVTLWRLIMSMLIEPPKRRKLSHVNTIDDVVGLIKKSKRIVVLTGAGVSVSCGIPDFRSRDGIYARLSKDFPDLPDPQAMFDIHYFRRDPRPFFKFAKEIYPGQFEPSPSHRFIKLLETHGRLLRNYTQNIDTLEKTAGIERVITCHGSFATASCTRCKKRVQADAIRKEIFAQMIPNCESCHKEMASSLATDDNANVQLNQPMPEMAVMKPDIVFFGESLSDEFHNAMALDKHECDLLIVMGSSLKVRPVALIPSSIDASVPQILINREPLNHLNFDVELLGDCDLIVQEICNRLGDDWMSICKSKELLKEIIELPSSTTKTEKVKIPSSDAVDGVMDSKADDEDDDDDLASSRNTSLGEQLPPNTYLFKSPSRYVFAGAEVYERNGQLIARYDSSDDDDDSSDDDDAPDTIDDSSCSQQPNVTSTCSPGQETGSSPDPSPSPASTSSSDSSMTNDSAPMASLTSPFSLSSSENSSSVDFNSDSSSNQPQQQP